MRKLFLLLVTSMLLVGCTTNNGRAAYERARQYMADGDAPQALACLKEAASGATGDDSLRVAVYNDMGNLLFDEGLQEQALVAYQKAYEANEALADTVGMAISAMDIANMYRTREDDDSCLYYFAQAKTLAIQIGDSELVADIHGQMAAYYLWHAEYEKARKLLMPLLAQAQPSGELCYMAAELYRNTGPADSTRYYCNLLLQEEETGHRQMGNKWLAELLLNEGQAAEASKHLKLYEELTDTLMEETDAEALRHVSALYNYSQREQENATLEHRVILAVSIVVVLLLLLLAVLLYFSRRRLKYKMKLQQLEQLLADYRKGDAKITDQQRQMLADSPIVRHIKRLLGESRQEPMTDEDWHNLEDTVADIQPEFLERLQQFYHFSPQELHICMLLRLGLQPAAIAQLTSRSKQTISSSRRRLFQRVFGQEGSPAQWDEFILSL